MNRGRGPHSTSRTSPLYDESLQHHNSNYTRPITIANETHWLTGGDLIVSMGAYVSAQKFVLVGDMWNELRRKWAMLRWLKTLRAEAQGMGKDY